MQWGAGMDTAEKSMDLTLHDGTVVTLGMVAEKNGVVITSVNNGVKNAEIVFFPDGRKYVPDAGRFTELR